MRLFPRIQAEIPVMINTKFATSEAVISNISVNGAFVQDHLPTIKVGDTLFLKYNLPNYGLFEHSGMTVRKDTGGFAMTFHDVGITEKAKLWKYIIDNLNNLEKCPYCDEKYEKLPSICKSCGWDLAFDSPGYIEYHEKRHLLKKMQSEADSLNADQIRRLINFIDGEILKEGIGEGLREFVSSSVVMKEVFSNIRKVAPTEVSVLIRGESGTGKELTALAIYERSMRSSNAFVPINCAAIPENLLEAELFGYERGAFTGAYTSRIGKFEHADGGTIFLDEIGEFSPNLQAKLLRFLENQIVERIGASKGKKVDVRFIAATNCDLESAIENGKFRKDLYYRLNAFPINLPPIRARGEDGIVLARYFLKRFSRELGVSKEFTEDAVSAIKKYSWPGNVREIINRVRKAIIMSDNNLVKPQDLDLNIQEIAAKTDGCLMDARANTEKKILKEVLNKCDSNISKAAKMLALSRPTLYRLKKKYGI
jgi:transcriptional regulator with GAF, ATPase, and Fis domain